ncbi:sodium-dependent phosphate cotransporter [Catalinimonas alkaloidigena]|uniref:Na/Pi symporter n=1 Tax=Catalinimonas alkaloidigena TaxID=1075417 RepID=UPI002406552C|nr:Na/Pi symporter [Catalinimonas alkaloidigena]MDF9795153.1 sodium-dependent phosphate cotransporter [Catalinimonas alkaloidigena]
MITNTGNKIVSAVKYIETGVKVIEQSKKRESLMVVGKVLLVLLTVLLFLISLDIMGNSFLSLRQTAAETILSVTANPFIGLFIGLLLTAIIQSSSTSTAMIVALVGSGALSLSSAVPIIMGANIGTTLTSTIISLGFITSKREFRKAISAGSVHDIYNLILTVILFPLEYYYQFLSSMSNTIAALLVRFTTDTRVAAQTENVQSWSPGAYLTEAVDNSWLLVLLSFIMLFAAIKIMSQIIYTSLIGKSKDHMQDYIFNNPYKSFAWGSVITAAVQSSSITTSLMVPLVATSKVSLQKSFPFIIGANIGTTVTALIAAIYKSEAAISIALVHFLFNSFGVLVFLPYKPLRRIPGLLAGRFGKLTQRNRLIGFIYIVLMFFLIPFLLIYLNNRF